MRQPPSIFLISSLLRTSVTDQDNVASLSAEQQMEAAQKPFFFIQQFKGHEIEW